ncbi:MAG: L,D-transpeptidase [Verrucomicrobia bacterium]|nr:L,D-transpeptidase [Verrucomicrobiota bacterium]MBV9276366.1 L,D-transpeptidase [Verrucomicrobiota bacterium]
MTRVNCWISFVSRFRVASRDRFDRLACVLGFLFCLFLCSCAPQDQDHRIVVSVVDQALDLYYRDQHLARYEVSTSRFGLGDQPGSCWTPLGRMTVAQKIGDGAPAGMVFKDRRPTGEILRPNAPGRDPIVTRILWLKGLDPQNRNAYGRCIYIHGTPVEKDLGRPASYGCIRMRSQDILQLFSTVGVGARVEVTTKHLPTQPNTLAQQAGGGSGAPIRE